MLSMRLLEFVSNSKADLAARIGKRIENNPELQRKWDTWSTLGPVAQVPDSSWMYGARPEHNLEQRVLSNVAATQARSAQKRNKIEMEVRRFPGLIRRASKDKNMRPYLKRKMKDNIWDLGISTTGPAFTRTPRLRKTIRKLDAERIRDIAQERLGIGESFMARKSIVEGLSRKAMGRVGGVVGGVAGFLPGAFLGGAVGSALDGRYQDVRHGTDRGFIVGGLMGGTVGAAYGASRGRRLGQRIVDRKKGDNMTREDLIEDILEAVFKGKGQPARAAQRKVADFLSTEPDAMSKSVFRHVKRESHRPRVLGKTYVYDGAPFASVRRAELMRKKVNGEWVYYRNPGKKEIDVMGAFAINPVWQPKSPKIVEAVDRSRWPLWRREAARDVYDERLGTQFEKQHIANQWHHLAKVGHGPLLPHQEGAFAGKSDDWRKIRARSMTKAEWKKAISKQRRRVRARNLLRHYNPELDTHPIF